MAQDAFMKGDDAYTRDINKTQNFDEILELSRRARDRSPLANGVTRNPITGQFEAAVRDAQETDESARAAASGVTHADGEVYSRTIEINGRAIEFSNTSQELLERDIAQAQELAKVWAQPSQEEQDAAAKNAREIAAADRAELERELRLGIIDAATYLERSGAVGEYLQSQGVDINTLREQSQKLEAENFQGSWAQATDQFLAGPGARYPGGVKNQKQMEMAIQVLGLQDQPSVESLVKAYEYLKSREALFVPDTAEAEARKFAANATPQEILEAWKQRQPGYEMGDASAANAALIQSFRRRG